MPQSYWNFCKLGKGEESDRGPHLSSPSLSLWRQGEHWRHGRRAPVASPASSSLPGPPWRIKEHALDLLSLSPSFSPAAGALTLNPPWPRPSSGAAARRRRLRPPRTDRAAPSSPPCSPLPPPPVNRAGTPWIDASVSVFPASVRSTAATIPAPPELLRLRQATQHAQGELTVLGDLFPSFLPLCCAVSIYAELEPPP